MFAIYMSFIRQSLCGLLVIQSMQSFELGGGLRYMMQWLGGHCYRACIYSMSVVHGPASVEAVVQLKTVEAVCGAVPPVSGIEVRRHKIDTSTSVYDHVRNLLHHRSDLGSSIALRATATEHGWQSVFATALLQSTPIA